MSSHFADDIIAGTQRRQPPQSFVQVVTGEQSSFDFQENTATDNQSLSHNGVPLTEEDGDGGSAAFTNEPSSAFNLNRGGRRNYIGQSNNSGSWN